MAQNFSTPYSNKAAQRRSFPIELVDVYLGSGDSVDNQTLFFNDSNTPVEFWPYRDMQRKQNYVALGMKRGSVSQDMQGQIESVEVVLDNVSRTFSTLFTQHDLRGKRIVIRRIFADDIPSLASGDFELIFDGVIDTPDMSVEDGAKIELKPSIQDSLNYKIPKQFYQPSCNNRFCDSFCANSAGPKTMAQLLQERTGLTIDAVVNQTQFQDAALTSEVTGDYDPAIIKITTGASGNVSVRRSCRVSGDTIRLDHPFPSDVVVGDTYSLQRDCGKEFERDCRDRFGNNLNFRGFRTLPKNIVQKN